MCHRNDTGGSSSSGSSAKTFHVDLELEFMFCTCYDADLIRVQWANYCIWFMWCTLVGRLDYWTGHHILCQTVWVGDCTVALIKSSSNKKQVMLHIQSYGIIVPGKLYFYLVVGGFFGECITVGDLYLSFI